MIFSMMNMFFLFFIFILSYTNFWSMLMFLGMFFMVSFMFYLVMMNFQIMFIYSSISGMIFDEMSLFMLYMLYFIMFMALIYSWDLFLLSYNKGVIMNLSLIYLFMTLSCLGVFMADSILWVYFFYELSLLPILIIIIKWGSYPERSLSAIMMLIYTGIFSFPFLLFVVLFYYYWGSFDFAQFYDFMSESNIQQEILKEWDMNFIYSFFTLLVFSVKLPIYGLHFWLPMAHVEAPTFGSMILAGVLLKLGGVCLYRFMFMFSCIFLKSIMAYFLVFLIYSMVICFFQTDFKRLVAYSSVCHMMTIPVMVISNIVISIQGMIMIMFYHALCSASLFGLVGILYSMFATRQFLLIRGLLLISPILSFVMVLLFFFNLAAPPFPSFISEMLFFFSLFIITNKCGLVVIIMMVVMSLVYNLLWFGSMLFMKESLYVYSFSILNMKYFLPIILSVILGFSSIFILIML